jgi:soluble lytic murein transglycosylase-like protein
VRRDRSAGRTSIDTGCLQVNLQQHPAAFATLADAFDPIRNTDYAARFLMQLRNETGNWTQAVGFYHSRTPALAARYRGKVERLWTAMAGRSRSGAIAQVQTAWASTLGDRPPAGGARWKPGDRSATWQGSQAGLLASADR